MLIDTSGSTESSDPADRRLMAAGALLDYMEATAELLSVNHRVGVASFGGEVERPQPFTSVTDKRLRAALGQVRHEKETNFQAALIYALREFQDRTEGTGRRAILVIFTDGRPDFGAGALEGEDLKRYFAGEQVPGVAESQQLNRQVAELGKLGAELFVVVAGGQPDVKEAWGSVIESSHYVELEGANREGTTYLSLLSTRITFPGVSHHTLEEGQSITLDIGPLVDEVRVALLKERPSTDAVLLSERRERAPLRESANRDGMQEYYRLDPREERWTIEAKKYGRVEVLVEERFEKIRVDRVFQHQTAGLPLFLLARISPTALRVAPHDLRLVATISGPGFDEPMDVDLHNIGDGQFCLAPGFSVGPGNYSIDLSAYLGQVELSGARLWMQVRAQVAPRVGLELREGEESGQGESRELLVEAEAKEMGLHPVARVHSAKGYSAWEPLERVSEVDESGELQRYNASFKLPPDLDVDSMSVTVFGLREGSSKELFVASGFQHKENAKEGRSLFAAVIAAVLLAAAAGLLIMMRGNGRTPDGRAPALTPPISDGPVTVLELKSKTERAEAASPSPRTYAAPARLRNEKRFWSRVAEHINDLPVKELAESVVGHLKSHDPTAKLGSFDFLMHLATEDWPLSDRFLDIVYSVMRKLDVRLLSSLEDTDRGHGTGDQKQKNRLAEIRGASLCGVLVSARNDWEKIVSGQLEDWSFRQLRGASRKLALEGRKAFDMFATASTTKGQPVPGEVRASRLSESEILGRLYTMLQNINDLPLGTSGRIDEIVAELPRPEELEFLLGEAVAPIGSQTIEVFYNMYGILLNLLAEPEEFLRDLSLRRAELESEGFADWEGAFTPEKTILSLLFRSWEAYLEGGEESGRLSGLAAVELVSPIPILVGRTTEVRFAIGLPEDLSVKFPVMATIEEVVGKTPPRFLPADNGGPPKWPAERKIERSNDNLRVVSVPVTHRSTNRNAPVGFEVTCHGLSIGKTDISVMEGRSRNPTARSIHDWMISALDKIVASEAKVVIFSVRGYELGGECLGGETICNHLTGVRGGARLIPQDSLFPNWRDLGGAVSVLEGKSAEHAEALRNVVRRKWSNQPDVLYWEAYLEGYLRDELEGLTGDREALGEVAEYLKVLDGNAAKELVASLQNSLRDSEESHWYLTPKSVESARVACQGSVLAKIKGEMDDLMKAGKHDVLRTLRHLVRATADAGGVTNGTKMAEAFFGKIAAGGYPNAEVLRGSLKELCGEVGLVEQVGFLRYRFANPLYYYAASDWFAVNEKSL